MHTTNTVNVYRSASLYLHVHICANVYLQECNTHTHSYAYITHLSVYCRSLSLDSFGNRVASASRKLASVTPPCSSALGKTRGKGEKRGKDKIV